MTSFSVRQRARNELWRRGEIDWKLHSGQEDLRAFTDKLASGGHKIGAIRTSRRFGKTYYLSQFAIQKCLKLPKIAIPFGAPTIKAIKQIILPIFHEILRDCPRGLRPVFKSQEGVWQFHNESAISLFGTDSGHAEKMRGIRARYGILDECGFMDDLQYIINDILTPALMYDDGFILASSTPPPTMDHYFVELLGACEVKGTSIHKTIWDNPLLKAQEVLQFAEALGCKIDWNGFTQFGCVNTQKGTLWAAQFIAEKSITFRRELEAEIIADPERKIIPEFDDAREQAIVKVSPKPKKFHCWTVLDLGMIDRTAVIYGYWDFDRAKAVIVDDDNIDFKQEGMTAKKLSERVLAKEKILWGNQKPYLRFGDGDLIALNELVEHGLVLNPVNEYKDILEAQVNQCRLDIMNNQLEIDPAAKNTIAQLKYGIWNKRRTEFERTDNFGHFDNLAALLYFLRVINRQANPYPKDYNIDIYRQHVPAGALDDQKKAEFRKMFGRR